MKYIIFITLLLFTTLTNIYAQGTAWEAKTAAKIAKNASFEKTLSLWFLEAETGNPLRGATVIIEGIGTFTTDRDGLIYFDTPANKEYSFILRKEGYCELDDVFEVQLGRIIFNRYSIPKVSALGTVKLVLDWGPNPRDLDLHLVKYGNNAYHISYRNMMRSADGKVWLDRDDTDGYGPETITITETDNTASYLVYVHNYTDQNNANSVTLSNSGAILRVYNNNRLIDMYIMRGPSQGVYWNAYSIKNGRVEALGSYTLLNTLE